MTRLPNTTLLILGVYPETEGYPNIKYRLEDLAKVKSLTLKKIHAPIWHTTISNSKSTPKLIIAWRFVFAHLKVLVKYLQQPDKALVYIPYPAVFISFLLSYLPKRYQPKRLIVDAFISLYDTLCIDRAYLSTQHILARLLYRIEQRAYRNCSQIVVDTDQNALYLSQLFQLPCQQFMAVPLSTNEHGLPVSAYQLPAKQTYRIVFVGTLIPLHGIEVILGAIKLLSSRTNLIFKIIGNGQLSPLITDFLRENPNKINWITNWQSQAQILDAINEADICLGIFGITAKTQRVCPLKIYSYAACGRAIITAETDWMRTHTLTQQNQPFILIPEGSADALAAAIVELSTQPEQITHYAQAAQYFYQQHLSNKLALDKLTALFFED